MFFDNGNELGRDVFYTNLQSIMLCRTQGREALRAFASEDRSKYRELTKLEQEVIADHFFPREDVATTSEDELPRESPILDDGKFATFQEWFLATVQALGSPPYKGLYERGLIFHMSAEEAAAQVMRIEGACFMLVCSFKKPGVVGIVIKDAEGNVTRRPLVARSDDESGVAASLMRCDDLGSMLVLREKVSVRAVSKREALEEFLRSEPEAANEDFPGLPICV